MPKTKKMPKAKTKKKPLKKKKTPRTSKKKQKQKKKLSRFESIELHEHLRMKSDLIYRILMSKDTSELDKILTTFRQQSLDEFPNISNVFKVQTSKALAKSENYHRIAKHGLFFFYLWMKPEYAQRLCSSANPKVDPVKFQLFYTEYLPKSCQALLQSKITTLQAFVERVRTEYVTL